MCLGVLKSWHLLFEDWFGFIEAVKVVENADFQQNQAKYGPDDPRWEPARISKFLRMIGRVSNSWYLPLEDWLWFIEVVKVAQDADFHQN